MEWLQPLVLLMLTWLITWGGWVTSKIFGAISRREWREDKEKLYRKLDTLQESITTLNSNVAVLNDRTRK